MTRSGKGALHNATRYLRYKAEDDAQPYARFFEPHTAPLQEHVLHALAGGMAPPEDAVELTDLPSALQRPAPLALETGWTRLHGRTYVSVLTRMPGVTAEMWDWWFGWHSTESARYKLWHPDAHQFASIAEDRSGMASLSDRQRYIDNVSFVDEYIGGRLQRLAIRFLAPGRLGFVDRPGHTYICARIGLSQMPLDFGWLVHQVRPTADGTEMRSRFVLNDVAIATPPRRPDTARPGHRGRALTATLRMPATLTRPALPRTLGPDLLHHCAAEMNHLARFLPALYQAIRSS